MRVDPIGVGGGINLYEYVWNTPVNLIDSKALSVADEWTMGEIEPWAIVSYNDIKTIPPGLADAKASISACCSRTNTARTCGKLNGANLKNKNRKAAWKNITNASGGSDKTGGGEIMCVGHQNCELVQKCWKCCKGGGRTLVKRSKPLSPTGTVTVKGMSGGTLYFYTDPLKGWCNRKDFISGCIL